MSFDPEAIRDFERASWNRVAAVYEASFASASRLFVGDVLEAAGVSAELRVLDVCCGTGIAAGSAAVRGAYVTGLDFSNGMLDVARRQYIGVRFDHGDAEALPYHDAAFDVVISHFGVHHVPRPIMALSEARRVLRPGGRVAFTIWAPRTENIAMKLVHDAIARHGDPALSTAPALGISLTVPDHCVAALRDAGFSDVRADVVGRIWHHPNAHSLVNALKTGTARMGARLSAQSTASLSAMLAEVEAAAAQYRDRDGIAVPMAAIVAAGTKLRPLA